MAKSSRRVSEDNTAHQGKMEQEEWWDLPIRNRKVAVYHAGRLLNQLFWHCQQSLFFASLQDSRMVDEVLDRLLQVSCNLSAEPIGPLDQSLRILRDRWRDSLNSERVADHIASFGDELDRDADLESERHEYCAFMLRIGVHPLLHEVRDLLKNQLTKEEQWLLHLGDRVDQALRRMDAYKFMYRPRPAKPNRRLNNQNLKQRRESFREELVNYRPLPGEPPLEDSWTLEIPELCQHAGVPSESIVGFCHAIRTNGSSPGITAVTALDHGIRELLEVPQPHLDVEGGLKSAKQTETPGTLAAIAAPTHSGEGVDSREFERLRNIKKEIDEDDEYIGQSLPILRMFERIADFNKTSNSPILLLGPTGAGKTEVVELIHRHSDRKGTFASEHSTAVLSSDEGIVREHWVGYGKGSTVQNAKKEGRDGLLQECRNGTIFFDELHGTPRWFQTFLLQVLDGRVISRPHGEDDPVKPEVRMIFASNRSLDQLKDEIQHDLLSRLRPWIIEVPKLADRKEDIVLFVEKLCKGYKTNKQFLLALLRHDWPGNVLELKNTLNQAMAVAGKPPEATASDQPSEPAALSMAGAGKPPKATAPARKQSVKLSLDHLRLANMSVIEEVRKMPETDAEREVELFLIKTFMGEGWRKGAGLLKRLADFHEMQAPAITKKLQRLEIDLDQEDLPL